MQQEQNQRFVFPAADTTEKDALLKISGLALLLGISAGFVAKAVTSMIGFVTNLAFFGEISTAMSSPEGNRLGLWVVAIPVLGGLFIGVMARYGSKAIRGHGIPETMEQVLLKESKIPARITILKPLSAAISIGTGGPFGAEGPIIATGGALGSLLGQLLHTTADQRKTLLAAGAAAGMSAIFGAPVSSVILAIELLLFEFRSRSFLPVAIASVAAAVMHAWFEGLKPIFFMNGLSAPSGTAIAIYFGIGAAVGLLSVAVTKLTYAIEDSFERLPIHWMWWPALGGIVVGICGYFAPETMGVGYSNITGFLNGGFEFQAVLLLGLLKLVSWSVALGSGTSGGTLAPLFTIGGSIGAALGMILHHYFPEAGVDAPHGGLDRDGSDVLRCRTHFAGECRFCIRDNLAIGGVASATCRLLCRLPYFPLSDVDDHYDGKDRPARRSRSVRL